MSRLAAWLARGLALALLLLGLTLALRLRPDGGVSTGPATAPAIPMQTAQPAASLPSATMAASAVPSATATLPEAASTPTAQPSAAVPAIVAYAVHTVAEGDTLASIAAAAGSSTELISAYNRLEGMPPLGRALVVPQLAPPEGWSAAPAPLLVRGRGDRPWVALTLDAGAGAAPVPQMLATLRERGVRLTFFLTGKWIDENPELVRQIVADGHELANHTYSHPDLTGRDDEAIRAELRSTEDALGALSTAPLRPLFRPPYGAYDQRVLDVVAGAGYLSVYWTLDSLDSVGEPKSPEFLIERVTATLAPEELPGAIILAHCGSQATADALPTILDRFAAMGLEVRPLSQVLGTGP